MDSPKAFVKDIKTKINRNYESSYSNKTGFIVAILPRRRTFQGFWKSKFVRFIIVFPIYHWFNRSTVHMLSFKSSAVSSCECG